MRLQTAHAIAPSIKPMGVSEIIKSSKSLLEGYFSYIEVFGEVSSITYHQSSGHVYFSLKDNDAELKCTFFKFYANKINFTIQKGDMLLVGGKITLYEARGEYQMQVQRAKLYEGVGSLHYQLERLKAEFQEKGYFDPIHKKPLPTFIKKIALVTSSSGAVVHDMQTVAQKRWRNVEFFLIPTLVQGEFASEHIAHNIRFADSLGVDVIIVARGGGSLEDLWAFNERPVIEAIFATKTPIVSAIGHATDTPLSDFVADKCAPTPSAAIENILPDESEWFMRLDSKSLRMTQRIAHILAFKKQILKNLNTQLSFSVSNMGIELHRKKLSYLQKLLDEKLKQCLDTKIQRLYFLSTQHNRHAQNILSSHKNQLTHLHYRLDHTPLKTHWRNKQSHLTLLDSLFHQAHAQNLSHKAQRLQQLSSRLEIFNPNTLHKRGFVQMWHNNAIGDLQNIALGECFILSDTKFQATVKLISKRPITQGEDID